MPCHSEHLRQPEAGTKQQDQNSITVYPGTHAQPRIATSLPALPPLGRERQRTTTAFLDKKQNNSNSISAASLLSPLSQRPAPPDWAGQRGASGAPSRTRRGWRSMTEGETSRPSRHQNRRQRDGAPCAQQACGICDRIKGGRIKK